MGIWIEARSRQKDQAVDSNKGIKNMGAADGTSPFDGSAGVPPPGAGFAGVGSAGSNVPFAAGDDGGVNAMQGRSAGYNASFGGKGKGGGGRNGPVFKPAATTSTAPQCPSCQGRHSDVRTCPGHIASQDSSYKVSTPLLKCSWKCYGKYPCNGVNHLRRHHQQQWVLENPIKKPHKQGT